MFIKVEGKCEDKSYRIAIDKIIYFNDHYIALQEFSVSVKQTEDEILQLIKDCRNFGLNGRP